MQRRKLNSTRPRARHTAPRHNSYSNVYIKGFTLVELLVTLLIVAIGFLGMAAQQSVALRQTQETYFHSQATILSADMVDRIRANFDGFQAGLYDNPDADQPPLAQGDCDAVQCDAAMLAAADMSEVFEQAASLLPGGRVAVSRPTAGNIALVSVMWDEQRSGAAGLTCNPNDADDLACLMVAVEVASAGD